MAGRRFSAVGGTAKGPCPPKKGASLATAGPKTVMACPGKLNGPKPSVPQEHSSTHTRALTTTGRNNFLGKTNPDGSKVALSFFFSPPGKKTHTKRVGFPQEILQENSVRGVFWGHFL